MTVMPGILWRRRQQGFQRFQGFLGLLSVDSVRVAKNDSVKHGKTVDIPNGGDSRDSLLKNSVKKKKTNKKTR